MARTPRRRPRRITRLRRADQLPKWLKAAGPRLNEKQRGQVQKLGPGALPVLWDLVERAIPVPGGGVVDHDDSAAWALTPPDERAAVHALTLIAVLQPEDGASRLIDRLLVLGGDTSLSVPLRDALTPYGATHTEAVFDALSSTEDFSVRMLLSSSLAGAGVKDARLRDILRNELLPRSLPAFLDSVRYTGDPDLLPDVLGLLQDAEAHPEAVDPDLWRAFMGAIFATGGSPPASLTEKMMRAMMSQGGLG